MDRSELHQVLKAITSNVYFQPPSNVALQYPCIVYQRDYADTKFADNSPHRITRRYQVMVVDRDPDSAIPAKIAELPMSTFNRFFAADDLNHDVFTVFF